MIRHTAKQSSRATHSPTAWQPCPNGLILRVRATPRAARNAIKGILSLPDGPALIITITAAPADGEANAAIIATLAKTLGVSKSAVRILSGATGRIKRVEVTGDAGPLVEKLTDIIAG